MSLTTSCVPTLLSLAMIILSTAPSCNGFLQVASPICMPSATNRCLVTSAPILPKSTPTTSLSAISSFMKRTFTPATSLYGSRDPDVDPSTLIAAQDDTTQQLAFAGITAGILAGSFGFVSLYDFLETILPSFVFDPFYTVLPYVMAIVFCAAGAAHFALEETFVAFVPPKGTWGGLWQIPAPGADQLGLSYAQYHSFWTGLAEIGISLSLIATQAGIVDWGAIPASLLWLLTLAVTPANLYMFTHNPDVPEIPPVTYPWGHAARGVLQMALLAVFFKLAVHSL